MTRLSTIHPYPAMVSDDLAEALSSEFVHPGSRFLDPFCGTGRLVLGAAEQGGSAVGVDVNRLATLITAAKATSVSGAAVRRLAEAVPELLETPESASRDLPGIETWFSASVIRDLRSLRLWIRRRARNRELRSVSEIVLSAVAREVSYARPNYWKLHRIAAPDRERFRRTPVTVFRRRLEAVAWALEEHPRLRGRVQSIQGDSRRLSAVLRSAGVARAFDIVITSPPYGDSRTTVQYGGMSGLCMSVIDGNGEVSGAAIDRACLGGRPLDEYGPFPETATRIWNGGGANPTRRRVGAFLQDLADCVNEIAVLLKSGGAAVFVVGRRRVGGWRLYLDQFLIQQAGRIGLRLTDVRERAVVGKNGPTRARPFARALDGRSQLVQPTMMREYVLVFRKG